MPQCDSGRGHLESGPGAAIRFLTRHPQRRVVCTGGAGSGRGAGGRERRKCTEGLKTAEVGRDVSKDQRDAFLQ